MKQQAVNAFKALGGGVLTRWLTRGSPRILMYHRFSAKGDDRKLGCENFELQIKQLKKHCNIVPMSELGRVLDSGERVPDNTAVITVDDGYADFYEYAFPILKRNDVPATIYIMTGFIDREIWIWPDFLEYILANTEIRRFSVDIRGEERQFFLDNPAEMRKAWVAIAQYCLTLKDDQKHAYLRELERQLNVPVPVQPSDKYKPLTWDQIREMSRAGIEIAGHTRTHPRLVNVEFEKLGNEIEGCKKRIEHVIEQAVYSFAYPNGTRSDYDNKTKELVRQAGYTSATVSFMHPAIDDRYELGRYPVSNDMRDFEHVLLGMRLVSARVRGVVTDDIY